MGAAGGPGGSGKIVRRAGWRTERSRAWKEMEPQEEGEEESVEGLAMVVAWVGGGEGGKREERVICVGGVRVVCLGEGR